MPYELENRLVIGVASSAMFDLSESDAIFRRDGEEKYRKFQEDNLATPLKKASPSPSSNAFYRSMNFPTTVRKTPLLRSSSYQETTPIPGFGSCDQSSITDWG
jgi:hypothetical protein